MKSIGPQSPKTQLPKTQSSGLSVWLLLVAVGAFVCGCQLPPSDACVKYVDCQKHYDDINDLETADLEEVYGEAGLCWRDNQSATSCTSTCEVAVVRLAEGLEATGDDVGPCD